MKILAIETSCDETGVALLECSGEVGSTHYQILGEALYSQIKEQAEFGGVYPSLAKRMHAKNITPLLRAALSEADTLRSNYKALSLSEAAMVRELLRREADAAEEMLEFLEEIEVPEIDAIAVTKGPGLEPALWVGIQVAKALSLIWQKPLIPVNHMEGHIISSLARKAGEREYSVSAIPFPLLALLISGAHTEFVELTSFEEREKIGETRDDAVGEAFDKVGRMLGFPYPGGIAVSKAAQIARERTLPALAEALPRPMLHSGDLDLSFSGLKSAVLYRTKDRTLSEEEKQQMAREFSDAVTEVLMAKTRHALEERAMQSLVVGGGVSGDQHLQNAFTTLIEKEFPEMALYLPEKGIATDNAVMIAMAAYYHKDEAKNPDEILAEGRMQL